MPLPSREREELRFDARGKRIPRGDRWNDEEFRWESPVLPSSELPSPPKARRAAGPFASRLQSILDDRPEAVDRLCAAAEARAAVRGEDGGRSFRRSWARIDGAATGCPPSSAASSNL